MKPICVIMAYSLLSPVSGAKVYPTLMNASWGILAHNRPLVAASRPPAKACDLALNACLDVVKAQDDSIANLKASVSKLEDALAFQPTPLLPTWAWIAVSLVVGVAAGVTLSHTK